MWVSVQGWTVYCLTNKQKIKQAATKNNYFF